MLALSRRVACLLCVAVLALRLPEFREQAVGPHFDFLRPRGHNAAHDRRRNRSRQVSDARGAACRISEAAAPPQRRAACLDLQAADADGRVVVWLALDVLLLHHLDPLVGV